MPTRKKTAKVVTPPKPKGREEIRASVLDAARQLFADRPYKDVTMRDIASASQVNLGLLHRHFGAKEQILHEVIESYASHFHDLAAQGQSPAETLLAIFSDPIQRILLRTLANLVLADLPVTAFVAHDGALSVLLRGGVAKGAKGGKGAAEKDCDVLAAFALLFGWSLFDGFLVEASENRVSRQALRERTFAIGREILSSTPSKAAA